MENGCPGFTSVILKKVDPRSKPMTIPYVTMVSVAAMIIVANARLYNFLIILLLLCPPLLTI